MLKAFSEGSRLAHFEAANYTRVTWVNFGASRVSFRSLLTAMSSCTGSAVVVGRVWYLQFRLNVKRKLCATIECYGLITKEESRSGLIIRWSTSKICFCYLQLQQWVNTFSGWTNANLKEVISILFIQPMFQVICNIRHNYEFYYRFDNKIRGELIFSGHILRFSVEINVLHDVIWYHRSI